MGLAARIPYKKPGRGKKKKGNEEKKQRERFNPRVFHPKIQFPAWGKGRESCVCGNEGNKDPGEPGKGQEKSDFGGV